jgi:hypothetical protein
VNARRVEVPDGAPVLDAVRAWDPAAAAEVERGTRAVTDSRGLPVGSDAPVYAGAIFRLVSVRDSALGTRHSEELGQASQSPLAEGLPSAESRVPSPE